MKERTLLSFGKLEPTHEGTRYWHDDGYWTYRRSKPSIDAALNAALLAIREYYSSDRERAELWLLRAYEANRVAEEKAK